MPPTEETLLKTGDTADKWLLNILRDKAPEWPWPTGQVKTEAAEKAVIETALLHGTLALSSHLLINTGAWKTIPASFRKKLKDYLKNEAAREMASAHELSIVLKQLAQNHIHPLLLKGSALGYNHYPKAYLRSRCDTDLLFKDKQTALKAWRILQEMGYTRSNAVDGELISYEFTCTKADKLGIIHALDCHWKVNNHQLFARLLPFQELEKNTVGVPFLGKHAVTLDNLYSLLFTCMHLVVHQAEGIDNRLIWAYDIHLLCNSFSDDNWKQFIRLSTEKQVCSICLDRFKKTQRKLGTRIPTFVTERLSVSSVDEPFTERIGRSQLHITLANFQALPSWQARIHLLKEYLFPDRTYIIRKYNIKSNPPLPALYFIRVLQGIYKFFKHPLP